MFQLLDPSLRLAKLAFTFVFLLMVVPVDAANDPPFWGIAYAPYHGNQGDQSTASLTDQQIKDDMPTLAALGHVIRTYSVGGAQIDIPRIAWDYAKATNSNVTTWVGGWIGAKRTKTQTEAVMKRLNDLEIQRLIIASREPGVGAVIVGNEVLLRGDQTPDDLIAYIQKVRRNVKNVPIAYADNFDKLKKNPRVVSSVDIVLANIHPYWDDKSPAEGAMHVFNEYRELVRTYPHKQVVIGEVGWPSDGQRQPHGTDPTPAGERVLIDKLLELQRVHPEMKSFYFDAFDEPWKGQSRPLGEGPTGAHWGVCNVDGSTKSLLKDVIPQFASIPTRYRDAGLIMAAGKLQAAVDMGVDTDQRQRTWVTSRPGAGCMDLKYPAGQSWGAVFFTSGSKLPGGAQEDLRGRRDMSRYPSLLIRMRAVDANATAFIGVKTPWNTNDGREPKVPVRNITQTWTTYAIPLESVCTTDFPAGRLSQLYVISELVFNGPKPIHLQVSDISFGAPTASDIVVPRPPIPDPSIVYNEQSGLNALYDLVVSTKSGKHRDWIEGIRGNGGVTCRYSGREDWAAVSVHAFQVDKNEPRYVDLSAYNYLVLDLKGDRAGESINLSVTAKGDDVDNEPQAEVDHLTTAWKTIRIPLTSFCDDKYPLSRFANLDAALVLGFDMYAPKETISFRNVRYMK